MRLSPDFQVKSAKQKARPRVSALCRVSGIPIFIGMNLSGASAAQNQLVSP
jgi:hypothetical protein